MKPDPSKQFCETLLHHLYMASDVCACGKKPNGVWWIVRNGDWFRPCWISVGEYSPGCIRVRSDINPGLPKTAWPHPRPDTGAPIGFELTFHESELDKATVELIFGACSIRDFKFASPRFKESGDTPNYAWTVKAERHYAERKKR